MDSTLQTPAETRGPVSRQGRGSDGSPNRKPHGPLWRRLLFLQTASAVLWCSLHSASLGAESRHYREAKDLYDKQQYLMAMLSAQKAVEEDPENVDYVFLYGLVLTELKQFSEAGVQLRKALAFQPDNAEFHYRLAALLLQEKMEWRATLKLDRRDNTTMLTIGTEQEALDALEKTVELDPEHFKARLHLGRVYYDRNQHQQARRQFKAVEERDPSYAWLHYHLAMLYSNVGDVQGAIQELEKELELHPEHSQARLELAEWLVKISQFKSALTHLSKVDKQEVNPVDLSYAFAKAHRGLGNTDQAMASARKCLEMDPEFTDAHYLLGQLYRETGQLELSRQSMETFQRVKKSPTR